MVSNALYFTTNLGGNGQLALANCGPLELRNIVTSLFRIKGGSGEH